ncbi:MAG TPA: hypothetical protein VFD27_19065 [Chthoniobacteraceae bacterium]|nr:hypothetical protein [Chthoniobacteraceae bacterium]
MKITLQTSILGLALVTTLHAGPRSSANYSMLTDTVDNGGKRTTSAAYTNDGSAGSVSGISTVGAPVEAAKHGYIGQLYDIAELIVNSAQPSVDEGASLQLGAWQLLDDATYLAVDAASVAWGAAVSPIGSISGSGLATAELVYQDTPASVQGSFGGFSGSLNLTVLNVATDDFGSYAGDGIGDDWQVQYFGLDNPNAAPGVDADGDGQDNRFEWTAGLIPTDAGSVFKLRIEAAAAQSALLLFSPIVSGRTYTVTYAHDLLTLPPWPALSGIPTTFDNGPERAVIDIDAHMVPKRFYRVEITKP